MLAPEDFFDKALTPGTPAIQVFFWALGGLLMGIAAIAWVWFQTTRSMKEDQEKRDR